MARALLVRLRTPRFAEAQRSTRRGFALILVLWAAAQFAVGPGARPYLTWAAAALALWLLARVFALGRTEKRQRQYEQRWLAGQTAALRDTWFEVVRCTVRHRQGPGQGRWEESGYELASREDVRELLARQTAERKSGRSSKVTVEFRFALPGRQYEALAAAHADLTDVELVVTDRQLPCGRVRFPTAAYHAETPPGRQGGYWPSRTTFWVLGEPLLFTASPDGLPAAPADSSAGGRLIG
ncbi:hypothetical protein [Streptomyces caeruleatus]|uniref:Uncharacterized protein n=1 Tax=Streptomyces caeruleatus TaxID=661399 RepID=A0A101TT19_9ACTN|nr:hypothetical protein [Streptomyces caeruleatus]KUN97952.1 hypothetical protein AQJ67_28645 [Streptomyces caeruleatus]